MLRTTTPVRHIAVVLVAALSAALVLAVTATATPGGESVKPAATILSDATSALESAPTVRIALKERSKGVSDSIVVSFAAPTTSMGTFSIGTSREQIIRLRSVMYIRGNAAFWGAKDGKLLAGHWVRVPAASSVGRKLTAVTTQVPFAKAAMQPSGPLSPTVTTSTYQGIAVAVLTDTSDGSSLMVTDDDASPLPVFIQDAGADTGTGVFTYGVHPVIRAPKSFITIPRK